MNKSNNTDQCLPSTPSLEELKTIASEGRIATIKRSTRFSPNHIGNDAKILGITIDYLVQMGYEVDEYDETEFLEKDVKASYIVSMAREKITIDRLHALEQTGSLIINSSFGIDNCIREKMTRLMLNNHIPHPASIIINTDQDPTAELEKMNTTSFWIKRGDSHTIHREDVSYARSVDEAASIVHEFGLRDIPNAVINEHLEGDLVKFYGVEDTDFFYWFYPFDANHSKFGVEKHNGVNSEFMFSTDQLKKTCSKVAQLMNVKIYGGDCVVSADGSFKIIDFNDWPSFAPCREAAAPYIAQCIHTNIEKMYSRKC